MTTVSFLGFIFESGQVHTDPEKIKAVAEWLVPENRTQIQQFLGFDTFYRKFKGITAEWLSLSLILLLPLDISPGLLRQTLPFASSRNCLPLLLYSPTQIRSIVEVDTSDTEVGAVLSQCSETDGKLHPCAFFS